MSLDGEEHHHLSRVARIKKGDLVWLFDDSGRQYRARVQKVTPGLTRLHILESLPAAVPSLRIILAFSVLKARAMEWLLQKATELGASDFIPLVTARTVVRIPSPEDASKKVKRWARIVREAAKQCGRSRVPTLSAPVSLAEFLDREPPQRTLFLFEHAERELRDLLLNGSPGWNTGGVRDPGEEVLVLAGPEGGWTNDEAMDILGRGFEAVSLGDNVLRAETAALSTLAVLTQFWK